MVLQNRERQKAGAFFALSHFGMTIKLFICEPKTFLLKSPLNNCSYTLRLTLADASMVKLNNKIWKTKNIYSETIESMQSNDSNVISSDKGISINFFQFSNVRRLKTFLLYHFCGRQAYLVGHMDEVKIRILLIDRIEDE